MLQIALLTAAAVASAQSTDPTPDTTPPIELDGSIGSGGEVPFANGTWKIGDDLGEYRGDSLLHSFGRFDVPDGQTAQFSGADGTERILARVTWENERSDIHGTIESTIPGADFYLINPEGIRFEGGAQLEVDGSVHVSTADSINFGAGQSFSVDPTAPLPLLSVGDPTSFGFLPESRRADDAEAEGRGAIEFGLLQVGPLTVPAGESFSAVARDVRSRSDDRRLTLFGQDTDITLIAAGPGVEVRFPLASFDPAAVDPSVELGEVDLFGTRIASSRPAGSVVIRGGSARLDSSAISVNHAEAEPSRFERAIDIAVRGDLVITNRGRISAPTAGAASKEIRLSGDAITVSADSEVLSRTAGPESGSTLRVEGNSLLVSDGGRLITRSEADGAGGVIDIDVNQLSLVRGGRILSEAMGPGPGGHLKVTAMRIDVSDAGFSPTGTAIASSTTGPRGTAAANITISADTISLRDGAQIFSSTTGSGNAGAVRIDADAIELSGVEFDPADSARSRASLIETRALSGSTGNAGELQPDGSLLGVSIDTATLHVADAAEIGTATQSGVGAAGDLIVEASDSVVLEGGVDGPATLQSRATASFENPVVGAGGLVHVTTPALFLRNGGQITSATTGTGDAGAIQIHADTVDISGSTGFNNSGVFAQTLAAGLEEGGDAGSVLIDASGDVVLRDGGAVVVSTNNGGNAGTAEIAAGGKVMLDDGTLTASTNWTGDAGDVVVTADELEIRGNDAGIFAQTLGQGLEAIGLAGGDAGDVQITTAKDVFLHDTGGDTGTGGIFVETTNDGLAGTVEIDAGGRLILDHSRITASSTEEAEAASGSIDVAAAQGVYLSNQSVIGSRAAGRGQAGTVFIDAGPVFEAHDSKVTTESITLESEGGGIIEIRATDRVVLTDTEISTSVASSGGNGGDIDIDPELMIVNRSAITAKSFTGNGGRIFISAGTFVVSSGSEVSAASTGGGIDGEVVNDSPDAELNTERAEPAQDFLDAAGLLRTSCGAASAQSGSFVVSRVAGLPASPEGPLPAPLWSKLAAAGAPAAGATPISDISDPHALRVAARADGCHAREEL